MTSGFGLQIFVEKFNRKYGENGEGFRFFFARCARGEKNRKNRRSWRLTHESCAMVTLNIPKSEAIQKFTPQVMYVIKIQSHHEFMMTINSHRGS